MYSKVYIQVPDTTIRNQFLNRTFGNSFIMNIGNAIEIQNQDQYIKSINSTEKGLYIMNMQKISDDAAKHTNKNRDILIILDEVHTHQLGENFQVRLEKFPNASYISFTATPRITGHDKKAINMTNTVYADGKNDYMDEFTSADAIDNNVIIPLKSMEKTVIIGGISYLAVKGAVDYLIKHPEKTSEWFSVHPELLVPVSNYIDKKNRKCKNSGRA